VAARLNPTVRPSLEEEAMSQQQSVSVETVKAILDAFNAHDEPGSRIALVPRGGGMADDTGGLKF